MCAVIMWRAKSEAFIFTTNSLMQAVFMGNILHRCNFFYIISLLRIFLCHCKEIAYGVPDVISN